MKTRWVNVLRGLRAEKDYALFGLVSHLNDLEITDEQILVRTHNTAEHQLLTKHLAHIRELAGTEQIIVQDCTQSDQITDTAYQERLQELFGDSLEIV